MDCSTGTKFDERLVKEVTGSDRGSQSMQLKNT